MESHDGGIRENARTGENAGRAVHGHLKDNCENVVRTGHGSDFYATGCRNGVGDGHHGASANGAPLTPAQEEMRERPGDRYRVDRARCDGGGECECP